MCQSLQTTASFPPSGRDLSSSLPVEEGCASSGMGFRAPDSLKGTFAGVSITGSPVVMDSSLGLGRSSFLPEEEACASSGMRFRAPKSLESGFHLSSESI